MTIKVDFLFHASTNKAGGSPDQVRTCGWSEGWYSDVDINQLRINAGFLAKSRARLLTKSAAVIGIRYRVVGGGSTTDNTPFPGVQTALADLPSMGLLCTVQGTGVPNIRRFTLRGLADGRIVEGEFVPADWVTAGLEDYNKLLAKDGWKFKGRILTNPKADIISISALGVVKTRDDISLSTSDKVRLLHVRDDSGVLRSGVYGVATVVDTKNFTLAGYNFDTASGGSCRKEQSNYFTVVGGSLARGRVITHKVGRSFFQFRGRVSKKR